jgi:hypothetical protein
MAKSSPEKLAKALRANLKKRRNRQGPPATAPGPYAPEAPAGHTESRPAPASPAPKAHRPG